MGPVILQAVERVWLSGALWEEHPWESAESALADVEKMSDREQLELFQKAIAALKLEIKDSKDPEIDACIGWEISEIEKACKFLGDRVHGNIAGQMSLLEGV